MRRMTEQLSELEIQVCKSINVESEDETIKEKLKKSAKARAELNSAEDAVNGELRQHLISRNSFDAGIISWIKPNSSTNLCPEAINMKEAMKYLQNHIQYQSNGYELLDIYQEEESVQFDKIMILLSQKVKTVCVPSAKTFSFPPYERLMTSYFPDGIAASVKYSKLLDAMAPILQTSAFMLEQVVSGSIKVTQSTGLFICYIFYIVILFIQYHDN